LDLGSHLVRAAGEHPQPRSPSGDRTAGPLDATAAATVRLRSLGLGEVEVDRSSQLGRWQQRNSERTIPHCVEHVHRSGAMGNLERVAQARAGTGTHQGMVFSDSDVYKVLEAAAWDSVRSGSATAEEFLDRAGSTVAAAQRADGYLDSWVQGEHPDLAWADLRWGHELYCAGHLLQAAVAAARTGACPPLDGVSHRLLEHLLSVFSLEDGDGRLRGVCGHPEIETALVEHYRTTGDRRALELAARQIDLRGRPDVALPDSGLISRVRFPLSYYLHHLPVRERAVATGHAVRELYLQCGVVDVAVETADDELLRASEAIWEDLYSRKTYVTGAHGSRHRDESIGDPYELPSDRAYGETCAAIAAFQWNWRLLLATGRARYAAAMEQVLWNTIAGAVSRDGTSFFYSNTLHLRTGHDADEDAPSERLAWYECACCPPNLARLMATVQCYLMTRDERGLQVHLPFSGRVSTALAGGRVELELRTGHPWDGNCEIEVTRCDVPAPWRLSVRVPEWSGAAGADVALNGEPVRPPADGGYLHVARPWNKGDVLRVTSPVTVRVLRPHWRVDAVRGCAALARGPLVYCLEGTDLPPTTAVEDVVLSVATTPRPCAEVPAGLEDEVQLALHAEGRGVAHPDRALYLEDGAATPAPVELPLTFVPYYARGHRQGGAMRVWVPVAEEIGSPPRRGDGEGR
jgi:DUF1680 family protein